MSGYMDGLAQISAGMDSQMVDANGAGSGQIQAQLLRDEELDEK